MKFEHRDGEDAAGKQVSVAPHLKPEVNEEGVFTVDEQDLLDRGIDPESTRGRLEEAGHKHGVPETVEEDVSDADNDDQGSETSEDGSEEPEDEGQEEDAATKTDLMNLKKDQLVTMAESFDDIDTDQNKEPLAEDLAGRVQLEGEE